MTRALLLAALALAAPAATPQDAPREKADDAKRERRVEQLQRATDEILARLREQEARDAADLAIAEFEVRAARLRRAADPPVAPPPREKASAVPKSRSLEEDAALWATRAAESEALLRLAATKLAHAQTKRQRADALFAQGAIGAEERNAAQAQELLARAAADEYVRLARADALRSRDARERLAFFARRSGAEVTGTLAVDVTFPDADRPRVAVAARGLVEAATASLDRVPAADWDAARRLPHVLVRFPTPHGRVTVSEATDVALNELLVPLPLTRAPGGFVLVRDGERVVRFSKYPHDACVRFQEALAAAVPAAR